MCDFTELSKIVSDDRIVFDKQISDKYIYDDLVVDMQGKLIKGNANVLIYPISTDEISEIMKFAYKNTIPVIPIGAKTGLAGATTPLNGEILLDLSKMNKIVEIDEETFTATVEAGVLLKDLRKEVENIGLFYPPDPGEKSSTIGGNIATNAGGMRAVKYGTTRDFVRGLEIVLSDGKIIKVGTKNIKDSSGLSLKNIFIGSEGTLGIITKAILKLIPLPNESVTTIFGFKSTQNAVKMVNKIMKANTDPVAIEIINRDIAEVGEKYSKIELPFKNAKSYLIVSYDGYSINERIKIAEKIAIESDAEFKSIEDENEANKIWKFRSEISDAATSLQKEEESIDIVVPLNKISDFVVKMEELREKTGLIMYFFGHAGDGNMHMNISSGKWEGKLEKRQIIQDCMDELYSYSIKILGGLPSGEHGIGICKQRWFLHNTDTINIKLMKEIKRVFDPKHILNIGKVYDN
jgi:glycolate oxidase